MINSCILTSNATTSQRSEAQALVCLPVRGAAWWALLQHYYIEIIFHRHMWCLALSLRYSTFGHHPHPLGYPCAKFHVFHYLHCSSSPRRKIAYSVTHLLTQLMWCPGTKVLVLWKVFAVQFWITKTYHSNVFTLLKPVTLHLSCKHSFRVNIIRDGMQKTLVKWSNVIFTSTNTHWKQLKL